MQIAHNQRFHEPTSYSKRNSHAHVSRTSSSKSIDSFKPGRTLLDFDHSVSNEAMPMQIAGPGNRTNPLRIVLPTCLRPFRTTIRNRPVTQAAAQAIEPARLLLLSERRGPISRVGNIKPRVGMSILLASTQITIPRAHRRRLSSILKAPSRRRESPGYFSYQTNGLPHLTHGVRTHIVATQQKTTRKKRPAKKPKPAENATMGPPCREIVPNCQKTPQGGLFLGSP